MRSRYLPLLTLLPSLSGVAMENGVMQERANFTLATAQPATMTALPSQIGSTPVMPVVSDPFVEGELKKLSDSYYKMCKDLGAKPDSQEINGALALQRAIAPYLKEQNFMEELRRRANIFKNRKKPELKLVGDLDDYYRSITVNHPIPNNSDLVEKARLIQLSFLMVEGQLGSLSETLPRVAVEYFLSYNMTRTFRVIYSAINREQKIQEDRTLKKQLPQYAEEALKKDLPHKFYLLGMIGKVLNRFSFNSPTQVNQGNFLKIHRMLSTLEALRKENNGLTKEAVVKFPWLVFQQFLQPFNERFKLGLEYVKDGSPLSSAIADALFVDIQQDLPKTPTELFIDTDSLIDQVRSVLPTQNLPNTLASVMLTFVGSDSSFRETADEFRECDSDSEN